jgi:hypothetical protein
MEGYEDSTLNTSVRNRFKAIFNLADLTIAGFNQFTGISESHLYAILNGTRKLTKEVAQIVGNKLNFDGLDILILTSKIPKTFSKNDNLNNFKSEFKDNPEYFLSTQPLRKKSKDVENIINQTSIFDQPIYLADAREKINSYSILHQYSSNDLSKILNQLVKANKLSKKRDLKKLKNGKFGKRIVDVFFNKNNVN